YDFYDALVAAPTGANGELLEDVHTAKAGSIPEQVIAGLPYLNARFNVQEVQDGKRLTPVTMCASRMPLIDSDGVQICLGDALYANVNSGRYGQMTAITFVVTAAHNPYGQLESQTLNDRGVPHF